MASMRSFPVAFSMFLNPVVLLDWLPLRAREPNEKDEFMPFPRALVQTQHIKPEFEFALPIYTNKCWTIGAFQ